MLDGDKLIRLLQRRKTVLFTPPLHYWQLVRDEWEKQYVPMWSMLTRLVLYQVEIEGSVN